MNKNIFMSLNEKSDNWLSIYKFMIKVTFWLEIIGGIIFGYLDAVDYITDIGYELEGLAMLIWSAIGVGVAFFNIIVNMLILQFLSNVNDIRKSLEK